MYFSLFSLFCHERPSLSCSSFGVSRCNFICCSSCIRALRDCISISFLFSPLLSSPFLSFSLLYGFNHTSSSLVKAHLTLALCCAINCPYRYASARPRVVASPRHSLVPDCRDMHQLLLPQRRSLSIEQRPAMQHAERRLLLPTQLAMSRQWPLLLSSRQLLRALWLH